VTGVNLLNMRGYGGKAIFIFIIFVGRSGQLCAPAGLATGKYIPVGLAYERSICGTIEAVWTCS